MVIKNLENKIKLVTIVCCVFLAGCVVISMSSIWTARSMVADAQKKIYVLDGTVPVLVERTTMDETLDVEAKSHIEMFHHFFKSFTDSAKCNLNIKAEGDNDHHKIESVFKAFAKAIKMAVSQTDAHFNLPSTKGVL